jgi:hypothetical protein
MNTPKELYAAVKPELGALAGPLFDQSEKLLRERGYFLPHAAVLMADDRVALLNAMCATPGGFANSDHILPMLRDGLRSMAGERDLKALGIAELVDSIPDGAQTRAVRVLLEHKVGLTLALYLPVLQGDLGEYTFGKAVTYFTEPEIHAWRP